MNDRELLELAAKAAGLSAYVYIGPEGLLEWVDETDDEEGYFPNLTQWWNPLRNRGDALWLAVRLGMKLSTNLHHRFVKVNDEQEFYDETIYGGVCDPDKVMRRTIVCVAAEMGRQMQDYETMPVMYINQDGSFTVKATREAK